MGITSRFGLRFPNLADPPNGPQAVQQLAEDVDKLLACAYKCTSTTRPSSPPQGMIIWETDTGLLKIRGVTNVGGTPLEGWRTFGTSNAELCYDKYAKSVQSVPGSTSTPLLFGGSVLATGGNPPVFTTAAYNGGTKFTATRAGWHDMEFAFRLEDVAGSSQQFLSLVLLAGSTSPAAPETLAALTLPSTLPSQDVMLRARRYLTAGDIVALNLYSTDAGGVSTPGRVYGLSVAVDPF